MSNSLDLALGRRGRNKIINPDGCIDQRNAGAKVTATLANTVYYGPDRRCVSSSQAGKLSIQQYAVALGSKQVTNYSTKVAVEATAAIAAADYNNIFLQAFEGLRMRDLLWGSSFGRPIAYTIQAQAPIAGLYSIALRNNDGTRSYVTTIQFNQPNVPETHTILVPPDTQGSWPTGTGSHLLLTMSLGAGANYTTANLNQWQGGNFLHAAGALSLMGTVGNAVYIAYDQLERDFATDFEIISDPELIQRACQRYWQRLPSTHAIWSGMPTSGATYYTNSPTFAPMRITPAISNLASFNVVNFAAPTLGQATGLSPSVVQFGATANVTSSSGYFYAGCDLNAELV